MTTTTASTRRVMPAANPGFGAALKAEWTKLRSVRATWIIVALIIGLPIGVSALTRADARVTAGRSVGLTRIAGYACLGAAGLIALYGIYLIIPLFH